MTPIEFINEIVFTAVEGTLILLVAMFVLNKRDFIRVNKLKTIVYIIYYTILSYWATKYLPIGIHTVAHIIFLLPIISFMMQVHIYASSVVIALYLTLTAIVELAVTAIFILFFRTNFGEVINNPNLKLIAIIMSKGVIVGIISFLYKRSTKFHKFNIFKREYSFLNYFLFQMCIMAIIAITIQNNAGNVTNTRFNYSIFIFLLYSVFIVVTILDYREREKMLKIKHKFEAQEEYVSNMENVIDIIRREKHDFANHLNTILAICTLNKADSLDKIRNYILELTDSYKSSYRFFNTGSDYIDGLLAVKSNYAYENEVDMEVSFRSSLDIIDVYDSDLISVIGNIVDNAFEAVANLPESVKKKVTILSHTDNGRYFVSISNNGPAISEKDILKIFDNGYSTKAKDKRERGYGLYITNQLMKRNSGKISVESTEHETRFVLEFQIKGEYREAM